MCPTVSSAAHGGRSEQQHHASQHHQGPHARVHDTQIEIPDVRQRRDHALLRGVVQAQPPRVRRAHGVALGAGDAVLERDDPMGHGTVNPRGGRRSVRDDVPDPEGADRDTAFEHDRPPSDCRGHRVTRHDVPVQPEADREQRQQGDGRQDRHHGQQPAPHGRGRLVGRGDNLHDPPPETCGELRRLLGRPSGAPHQATGRASPRGTVRRLPPRSLRTVLPPCHATDRPRSPQVRGRSAVPPPEPISC